MYMQVKTGDFIKQKSTVIYDAQLTNMHGNANRLMQQRNKLMASLSGKSELGINSTAW